MMLVFGPVSEPKGTYGISILAVDTATQAKSLIDNDPTVRAGLPTSVEFFPMRAVVSKLWPM